MWTSTAPVWRTRWLDSKSKSESDSCATDSAKCWISSWRDHSGTGQSISGQGVHVSVSVCWVAWWRRWAVRSRVRVVRIAHICRPNQVNRGYRQGFCTHLPFLESLMGILLLRKVLLARLEQVPPPAWFFPTALVGNFQRGAHKNATNSRPQAYNLAF